MTSRREFLAVSAATVAGGWALRPAAAVPTGSADTQRIDAFVRQRMQERRIPGLSIAVWCEGQMLFEHAYGVTSIELNAPATVDRLFVYASSSKLFAGPAILKLVQQGKLALTSTVKTLCGIWEFECPAAWSEITLRQLFSHTSGIASFDEIPAFQAMTPEKRRTLPAMELIRLAAEQPLKQAPGSAFRYGHTAYAMIGETVQRLSGRPYAQFVAEEVWKPAGMSSMRFGDSVAVIPNRLATGYRLVEGEPTTLWLEYPDFAYPAAGANGTARDLIKFFAALEAETLLPRSMQEQLWEPIVAVGETGTAGYGLGWTVSKDEQGRRVVGHEGGGSSFNRYYPDHGTAVVVLCNLNGSHADDIASVAAQIVFGDAIVEPKSA